MGVKVTLFWKLCFDNQVIVHSDFIREGKAVNEQMHIPIPRRLGYAVRKKHPKKCELTVGLPFTTMLQYTGRFWSRIS